jgi:hypothetical protein
MTGEGVFNGGVVEVALAGDDHLFEHACRQAATGRAN